MLVSNPFEDVGSEQFVCVRNCMLMRIDPATALHAATDDATATTAAAAGRVHEATDDDGRAGETATRVDAGEFSFRVLVSDEQQLMDVTRKQMQQQQQQQQQMMMQQQQQLMAQPTGYRSNNPFAPGGGGPSMSLIPESSPMPAPTPQAQPQIDFFQPAPQPAPQQQPERQGGFAVKTKDTNPELAALWANREGGLDTFGNVGSLRQSRPVCLHQSSTLALITFIFPLLLCRYSGGERLSREQPAGGPAGSGRWVREYESVRPTAAAATTTARAATGCGTAILPDLDVFVLCHNLFESSNFVFLFSP
jgi:hypothetical protein